MGFTPEQAASLVELERHVERQKLAYAAASDRRREEKILRREINASLAEPKGSMLPTICALSNHERRKYSVLAAIQSMEKRALSNENNELTLEKEISASLVKDLGLSCTPNGGILVPMQIRQSGLDTKTDPAGAYFVGSDVVPDIITVLRAKSVCMRLGATVISGLKGNTGLPLQSQGASATWSSENPSVDTPESDSAFGSLNVSPRTLRATTSYSRQLLAQSSPDIERFLRGDLGSAHAVAIDKAALAGTGVEGQPVGLMTNANVPVASFGANGAAPTGALLAAMEQTVSDASADLGLLAWVSTPTMRYRLRQVPTIASGVTACWQCDEDQDQLLGRTAMVSTAVPSGLTKGNNSDCHAIILGYWPALAIANWGVLEVLVDVYAQKRKAVTEITSFSLLDLAILRPTAFIYSADARNV